MIRPFFRHFGSKWSLSRLLDPPQFDVIVEPFAGSAGYAVRYGAGLRVVLLDVDPGVCSIWSWLIAATRADVLDLPGDLGDQDIRSMDVPDPARLLIQRWLTPQGGTGNWHLPPMASRWVERNPGSWWTPQTRARIANSLWAIRDWEVHLGDYQSAPDLEATWVVDPPYQGNTSTPVAYGRGSPPLDYPALGTWCRGLRGQVYVHEQAGATWLPFTSLSAQARTGRVDDQKVKRQAEVIWSP